MTMISVLRTLRYGCARRPIISSRRHLSTTPPPTVSQAFLEPLTSHPGISCLSLNRPHTKNAISTTLLKVESVLFPF